MHLVELGRYEKEFIDANQIEPNAKCKDLLEIQNKKINRPTVHNFISNYKAKRNQVNFRVRLDLTQRKSIKVGF